MRDHKPPPLQRQMDEHAQRKQRERRVKILTGLVFAGSAAVAIGLLYGLAELVRALT